MLANPNPAFDGANPSPQQWQVPSPAPDTAVDASTQNVLRRAQMPQPEYRALAAWLVAPGFAVRVPERLDHRATGRRYLEDGGKVDFRVQASSSSEGHWLAETAVRIAGPGPDRGLKPLAPTVAKKR